MLRETAGVSLLAAQRGAEKAGEARGRAFTER